MLLTGLFYGNRQTFTVFGIPDSSPELLFNPCDYFPGQHQYKNTSKMNELSEMNEMNLGYAFETK